MPLPTMPRSTDDIGGSEYMDAVADNVDALKYNVIQFLIGDGESPVETGVCANFIFPNDGIIEEWRCFSPDTGSLSVSIWKRPWGGGVPTSGNSIVASAPIALSGAVQASDDALSGWSKEVAENDVGRLNVNSVSGISSAVVVLKIKRT